MMKLIHIAPTSLMSLIDERYNKGTNMLLAHLVLGNEAYRAEAKKLNGVKYLDNSFFELGYCMEPDSLIDAAALVDATHLICPDGTTTGLKDFKRHGYKAICIPKTAEQFQQFMYDPEIDLVGVSEEHLDYRHSPGARYELFRDYITADMPKKKIHLLGATDSAWELGMLSPFDAYIESWDSSAAIWQGHLGQQLSTMRRKDYTSVDFNADISFNLLMADNISFIEEITSEKTTRI